MILGIKNKKTILLEAIERKSALAKNDLRSYLELTFNACPEREIYKPHWSTDYLIEHLQLVGKEIDILLVSLPRGWGKSIFISEIFPAWKLYQRPYIKISCITSKYDNKASAWHRNSYFTYNAPLIKEMGQFTDLHQSSYAEKIFKTKAGGFRQLGSVKSPTIGGDVNGVILDDPITENHERSKKEQEMVERFYKAGLLPAIRTVKQVINQNQLSNMQKIEYANQEFIELKRTESPFIINSMQRLHKQDSQAMLLKLKDELEEGNSNLNIVYLDIPAIADRDRIYTFPISKEQYIMKQGEYLEAGTLDKKRIDDLKIQLGDSIFQAQMQQNPIVSEDYIIKEDRLVEYEGSYFDYTHYTKFFMTCDTAMKTGEHNDFTVCVLFGVMRGEVGNENEDILFVIDVLRGKWHDVLPEIYQFYYKWSKFTNHCPIYIEDKVNGSPLIHQLRKKGIDTYGIQRYIDIEARMSSVINYINARRLAIPSTLYDNPIYSQISNYPLQNNFINDLKNELLTFRREGSKNRTSHDDIVSCIIDGLALTFNQNSIRLSK